jgi:diguanylate cyclase (GGDEF)-like protein
MQGAKRTETMTVLTCLTSEHDLVYLAIAAGICAIGSFLITMLLQHVRSSSGLKRINWILISGITGGCVIWTVHYAAMVGFVVPLAHSYDPFITIASLFVAICATTVAAALMGFETNGPLVEAGGGILGLGMCATHAVAMRSYVVQAHVEWSMPSVVLAMSMAVFFGVLFANRLSRPCTRWCRFVAIVSFFLAIVTMHFMWMSSLTLTPDPAAFVPVVVVSDTVISVCVLSLVSLLLMSGWAFYIIDAKSFEETQARFRHLEQHDALTELANRTWLAQYLDQTIKQRVGSGKGLAVLYFDLRRFKAINDVHGHGAGDEVLKRVARRLVSKCPDGFMARVGGDEFVAVLDHFGSTEDVTAFAASVAEQIGRPILWNRHQFQIGTSIGVSLYPFDGRTSDILMSKANLAMQRARTDGDHDVVYYDRKRDEANRSRSAIAMDLRRAIDRQEFEIYYQPQNDARSRDIVGFEALLRWNHPELGRVLPKDFIPVAEAYGMIPEIGEYVLRRACMEVAGWPGRCKIAVNVAPDQLCKPNLPQIVAEALAASGLEAGRLELEITETGIVQDQERALDIVHQLKEMGVGLAMDDYGTGSSSLSTLRNFPFTKIKIDKSFVTDLVDNPQSAAIVRSTVILGKSLKIPVLAEGVESEGAMKFLRRIGCAEVQGFLFGRPVSAEDARMMAC